MEKLCTVDLIHPAALSISSRYRPVKHAFVFESIYSLLSHNVALKCYDQQCMAGSLELILF